MKTKSFKNPVRIGVVGTGYVSKGFCEFASTQSDIIISSILTRRKIKTCDSFQKYAPITNSIKDHINRSDIILEVSGGIEHVAEVVKVAHDNDLPVVTLNADFHVIKGSQFVNTGYITEAEGDQPGALCTLHKEVVGMGFEPIVYGNIKGFLNHTPTMQEMDYWSKKQGLSMRMVTAFTDGSKLQSEMALTANCLDADLMLPGMLGYQTDSLEEGAQYLAQYATKPDASWQTPVVDYILQDPRSEKKLPNGVFIVARHEAFHQPYLQYYKLGEGPFYLFHKPYYLPHLEIIKTIRSVIDGHQAQFNNGINPTIGLVPITKRNISKNENIHLGLGGFDVRVESRKIKQTESCCLIGDEIIGKLKNATSKGQSLEYFHLSHDNIEV